MSEETKKQEVATSERLLVTIVLQALVILALSAAAPS